jgi:hypothetical protein
MMQLLAVLLLSATAVHGEVVVPRCQTPPQLDGALDDACWKAATWHSDFRILNTPEVHAPVDTAFAFAHDGRTLYFAAKLTEPNVADIKTEATERDGKVHGDGCIEIMLDANGDHATYFHFIVNSIGAIYDAQRRQGGHVATAQWSSDGARTATKVYDDRWVVEMSIPLADLGLDEGSLGMWYFNVARERYAGGTLELFTHAPLTGGFHAAGEYLPMRLEDADIGAFLWEVRTPFNMRTTEHGDGIAWTGKTFIGNRTGEFRFIRVTAQLDNGDGEQVFTTGMDTGLENEVDLVVPAGDNGPAMLAVTIAERRSGDVLAVRRFPVSINYTPLQIDVARPIYRNNIYATQQLKSIAGSVRSSLGVASLAGLSLRIALRDSDGNTLAEAAINAIAEDNPFELPLPSLADGAYTLAAELVDDGGKAVHTATTTIRKLPPHPNEVRLDENMVTRVNGEPFLPWGWFSIHHNEWPQAAAEGYNVHVDYNAYFMTDEQLQAFFDRARELGLKVVIYPYPRRDMVNTEPMGKPLSPEDTEAIRQFVRKWKNEPALLGWYMGDEPELRPTLPARLEAVRQVCADEDPYHPCIVLNDTIPGIHDYIDGCDVSMPDPYPLFIDGGMAARSIDKVGKFMQHVQEASQGRRGAWITPQAFNYGDNGAVNNREPNFVELRNMTWQSVIARTTGFAWYTWYQGVTYGDMMEAMRWVTKEVKLLEPVILAPQANVDLATSNDAVQAAYRKVGGHEYILALSTATEAVDATVTLPNGAASTWHVIGEARQVQASNGNIAERFDVYETHLYTTDADLAAAVSLDEARAGIEKVRRESHRPGNMAYESTGVQLSTDSHSRAAVPLTRAVNGSRTGLGWHPAPAYVGHWLELAFAKPTTIGRVELYGEGVLSADVRIWRDGQWDTVAAMKDDGDAMIARFDPVSCSKLRVVITEAARGVRVAEVEAYAK